MGRTPRPPAAESVWNRDAHVPALDGVRGLAILLVILFHHTQMQSRTWFDEVWIRIARFCWSGVDLFFVLSGFLITGILFRTRGAPGYFRSFYARRTLRIFPLYYVVVAFSLYVLPRLFPESDLAKLGEMAMRDRSSLWYWLYLANFLVAEDGFTHPILSIAWSLAIEEQFYLVWAVVVWLAGRRTLMALAGAMMVAALALRILLVLEGARPAAIYVWTFTRMDTLALGALLALAVRDERLDSRLARVARVVLPVTVAAIAFLVYREGSHFWGGPLTQTGGYTILALFYGSLLVLALPRRRGASPLAQRVFTSAFLRWLGRYSYALYLFHVPIRRVVRDNFYGVAQFPTLFGSQLPGQLLFYVVATAPAALAAWASWHLLEKHALRLKRFFPYGGVTKLAPARQA
jgi:peptidoglycan/LPS O-acetylase OafA/YrhL